jgi:NitT/TauT family transport system substrate-binding protein
MNPVISRKQFLLSLPLASMALASCKKSAGPAEVTADGLTKIKVGYIGITCEASLFAAVENGFFKEEGLAVELVKCEWSKYKDVLALGGFDVTHHLIMMFLKPIEQGLDVKITAGVHRGCLRVQSALNGPIKTVQDLRGKRIGVPGMGTPPFIFANRVLGSNGIDPKTEIEWRSYPAGELGLALKKGEIDAIANSEPIGTLLLAEGLVQNVADQATDLPYSEEYCCGVIVNGKFLANNPEPSAKATRAILKGARWVETNPRAAARMSVEKGYLASNPELNTTAIGHLRYIPSVSGGESAVLTAATGMKKAGMLLPTTDLADLTRKAWAKLEGVTDDWVNNLKVAQVPGGQIPPDQAQRLAVELATIGTPFLVATCCSPASKVLK